MKSIKPSVAAVVSLAAFGALAALDGTLKWKGDPMGGEWCDAANWEVSGTSSYTVEELLAKKGRGAMGHRALPRRMR